MFQVVFKTISYSTQNESNTPYFIKGKAIITNLSTIQEEGDNGSDVNSRTINPMTVSELSENKLKDIFISIIPLIILLIILFSPVSDQKESDDSMSLTLTDEQNPIPGMFFPTMGNIIDHVIEAFEHLPQSNPWDDFI